ncbi:MAG: outer membrane lipoprotein carrier protein LolA [Desulfuromonadaceae bacterium]|nr:outer membrane lipoprotein carrier protein LolA [Desulfuromonadaceae bacterium]
MLLLAFSLVCCVANASADAQTPVTLAEVQQELKLAAEDVETLQSDILQEKHLAMFAETLRSTGRFIFARPDRLRWEMLKPVASGFVLQGEAGTRWNALSKEVGHFNISADPVMGMVAQQLLAWARVDLDWLNERYSMELICTQPVTLHLLPRDPGEAQMIESLSIVFAPDRSHVAEVVMREQGGDYTRMSFSSVQVNAPLPPTTFEAPKF